MLSVLVELVGEALKKIFDVSVDKVIKKVSEKRSLAIALLELYDAMVRLEESSQAALELFRRYQHGIAVPLRIKVRSAMNELVSSVEEFDTRLREVYSRLHIYESDLFAELQRGSQFKVRTLEVISVLLEATPRINLTGKYPTDDIIIPTAIPKRSFFGKRNFLQGHSVADPDIGDLKKQIDRSLKKRNVNFSDSEELALILQNGESNLNRLEIARRNLAEFIRQNVPLSEILLR